MKTVGFNPIHGEPDTVKVVRPVRREGRRNLSLKSGKALLPYSTVPMVVKLALEMGYPEAALWVHDHQAMYVVAVFRGFRPVEWGEQ